MHKHLFIAEKPNLAKTIADARAKMLGVQPKTGNHCITVGDDAVTWVRGHVYELAAPHEYDPAFKRFDISHLPIVPDKWKRKPKQDFIGKLNRIRELIRSSDKLVNAGDAEREGQLLIDEVLEEMGVDPFSDRVLRFWASSMAERDLIETLNSLFPNSDKKNLSIAAMLRQRADWLHGLNMTRLYTEIVRNSGVDMLFSVGRVQTPTLKLVVDRDREIANFKPVDHYAPTGFFIHENGKFKADWIIPDDKSRIDPDDKYFDLEGRLVDKVFAKKIADDIAGKRGKVESFKSQNKSNPPPLPHSLATLQQECSKKLGLTAQQTLDVAQELYEKHKATTYPRTETQHLPNSVLKDEASGIMSALASSPGFEEIAGNADLKLKSAAWDDSKLSDHYGIIPTSEFSSSKLRAMSPIERSVFELIAKLFIAQFYPAQTWKSNSAVVVVDEHRFKANGRDPISAGWRVVYGAQADEEEGDKESDQKLPTMKKSDPVSVERSDITSKRTKPPAHFTDGTLIEAMSNIHKFVSDPEVKKRLKENDGIGTGATRAGIIEKLIEREFIQRKGGGKTKKVLSTTVGQSVIDVLPAQVVDPGLTSIWEAQLSKISKGEASADQFTDVLINTLNKFVEQGRKMGTVKVRGADTKALLPGTGNTCPKCGKG
ncbi:DNA topoisomerase 3, partial [Roseibium sp. RKSG952]|uniref:DNA topoisomerase 3 n=1 Tax=Roseibium sp. RKSG952 TaxID=2529384 RepID=UPI0012BD00D3